MIQPADRSDAVSITIALGIILVGSLMPWGQMSGSPFGGMPMPGFGMPLTMSITVTAWNGNLNLMGITIPNSIVVLIALFLAAASWLQAAQIWSAPRALFLALAAYATFHTIWFVLAVLGSGSIGIGSILTAAACGWILAVSIRRSSLWQIRESNLQSDQS